MTALPAKRPIRVKFISRIRLPDGNIGRDFARRFPGGLPRWGNCEFLFDRDERTYDWLVVYDDLPRDQPVERLTCGRGRTMLLTGEPSSITHYGPAYLSQFGHVLTSQEPWALDHPGVIRRQAGLLWYYGGSDARGSYDALRAAPVPEKTRPLSTVCSTKAMRHTLHHLRLGFTRHLQDALPEIDVFGYGMKELHDKADALDPYRYHLAIENHRCDHHWTEKLADAYLGFCLPVYFGCTNLSDYFPEESYLTIDIRDFDRATEELRALLASDEHAKRLPAIVEARRRVLEDYATFPQLARLIEERHDAAAGLPGEMMYGRRKLRRARPLAGLRDGVARGLHRWRFKSEIRG